MLLARLQLAGMFFVALSYAGGLAGCVPNGLEGKQFACDSGSDCLSGFFCQRGEQVCLPLAHLTNPCDDRDATGCGNCERDRDCALSETCDVGRTWMCITCIGPTCGADVGDDLDVSQGDSSDPKDTDDTSAGDDVRDAEDVSLDADTAGPGDGVTTDTDTSDPSCSGVLSTMADVTRIQPCTTLGELTVDSTVLIAFELPNLVTVTGAVRIANNSSLTSVSLPLLETAASVEVSQNSLLTGFALPSFASNGDLVNVSDNPTLATMDLSALTNADKLQMLGNSALTAVELTALQTLSGWLHVSGLGVDSLALPALTSIAGDFELKDCARLLMLDLSELTAVGTKFTITNNLALRSVAISAITTVGSVEISWNPLLCVDASIDWSTVSSGTITTVGNRADCSGACVDFGKSATIPTAEARAHTAVGAIEALLSCDVAMNSLDRLSFVVTGHTGPYAGAISSPTPTGIRFVPTGLRPGDRITATATSRLRSTDGSVMSPWIWQFWVATASKTANMVDSGQSFDTTPGSIRGALGDVDADGDLDILTAHALLLNNGLGVFTDSGQVLEGGVSVRSVAMGDLDGDGDLDAFFANEAAADARYLNNGSGVFTHDGVGYGSEHDNDVSLFDIDGDGDLDVVVTTVFSSGVAKIWRNDGVGGLTSSGGFTATAEGWVDNADLDADGDLDAVTTAGTGVRTWQNDGSGNFTAWRTISVTSVRGLAIGDVNGDGAPDLYLGRAISNPDQIWLNDGAGQFADSNERLGFDGTEGAAMGDVDGDGDLDVVATHTNNKGNVVWLNDGAGAFTLAGNAILPTGSGQGGVMLGDVNGDAALDVVTVYRDGAPVRVLLNQ